MAPSTTVNVARLQDPGGQHPNISTPNPLHQGQHGNTGTGNDAPDVVTIVVGVVVPLVLIGVGAFLIYVWYRRKYPVRMVPGRDFAKFSNPVYNKRQSTLTLVREDGDKEWDYLDNPNPNLDAVNENTVDGIDNAAFEQEIEKDETGESSNKDVVKVEIEPIGETSDSVEPKVENEAARKISRDRPKTKKAVLVTSQATEEFESAFELVTESDLGQRTDSERSSGNDSTETHTVSISFAETFDNRHGSLASQPEELKTSDTIATKPIEQTTDEAGRDASVTSTETPDIPSSAEETEKVDMFESFVEVFNNESLEDNVAESPIEPASDINIELPGEETTSVTDMEDTWTKIEPSAIDIEGTVSIEQTEVHDINEKERTEGTEKDNLTLGVGRTKHLSVSEESIHSLNSPSLKRPSLSLSSERIHNFIDIEPQTPTVLVQDSIIFESESMPQIHVVTPTGGTPIRGRRAFTLNDLNTEIKLTTKVSATSEQNLARHADARSTSSPEIRQLQDGMFTTADRKSFDASLLTSQMFTETNITASEPVPADNNHETTSLSDNMLLESTFIKNEVRNAEKQTAHILNTVEELNTSLCESINSEPNEIAKLQNGADENRFMSSSSDVSESFETSGEFNSIPQENNMDLNGDSNEINSNQIEEIVSQSNGDCQVLLITASSEEQNVVVDNELSDPVSSFLSLVPESASPKAGDMDVPLETGIDNDSLIEQDSVDDITFKYNDNDINLQGLDLMQNENVITSDLNTERGEPNPVLLDLPIQTDSLHTEPSLSFIQTLVSPVSGSEDTSLPESVEEAGATKKTLAAGGFDFDASDDCESDTSSSSSESSDNESLKSLDSSIEETASSDNDGPETSSYSFEKVSNHSKTDRTHPPDGDLDMSKSADSTTLSWELLSRENSLDSRQVEPTDDILADIRDDSISTNEGILVGLTTNANNVHTDPGVQNVSFGNSDLSWDIIGENDENSEC